MSSAKSRGSSAAAKGATPDWREPKSSPGPRISKSRSAMRKPSVVSAIAARRASPSGVVGWATRMHALRRASPDASAKLMKLGEAEALGVLDHHHRCIGHVDADLDHDRRDERIDLAGAEAIHDRLPLRARQATVDGGKTQSREGPGDNHSRCVPTSASPGSPSSTAGTTT
ncbi:MAG: hypothetical protein U0575_07315 [Phycisphaerales bacterium]